MRAEELIGRARGMFVDRVQNDDIDFDNMSASQPELLGCGGHFGQQPRNRATALRQVVGCSSERIDALMEQVYIAPPVGHNLGTQEKTSAKPN